jgi:hypothetical protein
MPVPRSAFDRPRARLHGFRPNNAKARLEGKCASIPGSWRGIPVLIEARRPLGAPRPGASRNLDTPPFLSIFVHPTCLAVVVRSSTQAYQRHEAAKAARAANPKFASPWGRAQGRISDSKAALASLLALVWFTNLKFLPRACHRGDRNFKFTTTRRMRFVPHPTAEEGQDLACRSFSAGSDRTEQGLRIGERR